MTAPSFRGASSLGCVQTSAPGPAFFFATGAEVVLAGSRSSLHSNCGSHIGGSPLPPALEDRHRLGEHGPDG